MQVLLSSLWNTATVLALKGQLAKTQFLLPVLFSMNSPVIFIFALFLIICRVLDMFSSVMEPDDGRQKRNHVFIFYISFSFIYIYVLKCFCVCELSEAPFSRFHYTEEEAVLSKSTIIITYHKHVEMPHQGQNIFILGNPPQQCYNHLIDIK